MAAMAHNLGRLMRSLFGLETPRGLQPAAEALSFVDLAVVALCGGWESPGMLWRVEPAEKRSVLTV
jgi:hypothetical protein